MSKNKPKVGTTNFISMCPYCEEEQEVTLISAVESVEIKGEVILVNSKFLRCLVCGGDFEEPSLEHEALTLAVEEYKRRHFLS